mmetsp:Transcript_3876/g.8641  ORF Transcript_3876/g.8641 Transcript_3876/m.8641 type:complete len:105 (-) Transcript_3876:158-472(-)
MTLCHQHPIEQSCVVFDDKRGRSYFAKVHHFDQILQIMSSAKKNMPSDDDCSQQSGSCIENDNVERIESLLNFDTTILSSTLRKGHLLSAESKKLLISQCRLRI